MANKLYEETDVQSIAEALRLKNDGDIDVYTISDMNDGVLTLPFGNIPSYHYAEAGRVIKKLLELKAQYPNNIVFGTISDNHPDKTNANSLTSARHAVFALEAVGATAQCDFVANLGDNLVGTNIDTDTNYADAVYMENAVRYAISSMPSFNLVGNHCKSNSTQKIYNLIGKYNSFDSYGATQIRGYGYKDFTDKKVRIISLNTCDYLNGQGGNGMSYEQKDFLMRSLDLSSKDAPAEWTIIILSHIPLDFLGGDYNKGADLKAILKAYANGTTASITVNSTYASQQSETPSNYATYVGGNLVYNYAGKNAAKVINIHGHIHTNAYGKLKFIDDNTELNIVRVATANSAYSQNKTDSYPDNGEYSISTTEAAKIAKSANSAKDTSATFYFIDLDGQTIYSVGYGADVDRTIIYKDATIYGITYNLTNVTSSNNQNSIVEGQAYATTLSIGEDYNWGTVTVKMGGVDITSTALSNHVVSIPTVTGDIVITATATVIPFTYVVPDLIAATRMDFSAGGLIPTNSNPDISLFVTTANAFKWTDREGHTIYAMPVPAKAKKVTVLCSDTAAGSLTGQITMMKNNNGSLSLVSQAAITAGGAFTLSACDYIVIRLRRNDGSSWAWGYGSSKFTVTFTN